MLVQECTKRSFAFIEKYLEGKGPTMHRIDAIDLHHALKFPNQNPKTGHRVTIEDTATGQLHGVAFKLFHYSDAPDNVMPMEAFSFDPQKQHATIGIGFLRRLGRDRVQLGFLEVLEYVHENEDWTKVGHERRPKGDHPLIDSAMASWKFGAHMEGLN